MQLCTCPGGALASARMVVFDVTWQTLHIKTLRMHAWLANVSTAQTWLTAVSNVVDIHMTT